MKKTFNDEWVLLLAADLNFEKTFEVTIAQRAALKRLAHKMSSQMVQNVKIGATKVALC
jgi:hypothetical protein